MGKEAFFEHESYQDRETIKHYLESLLQGIESGKIVMNSEKSDITLDVNSLIKFKVTAQKKSDRNKMELVLSWRDGKAKVSQEKIFIGS
ncbi:MAG: amphi-Trp domain-containing protein [Thermodesulfobacteriota bacterium]|nr:amphi-Trp domain-containing protein [Thermodesulfobacteriota bacterium]